MVYCRGYSGPRTTNDSAAAAPDSAPYRLCMPSPTPPTPSPTLAPTTPSPTPVRYRVFYKIVGFHGSKSECREIGKREYRWKGTIGACSTGCVKKDARGDGSISGEWCETE